MSETDEFQEELKVLRRARETRESGDPLAAARIVSAWTEEQERRRAVAAADARRVEELERELARTRAEAAQASERTEALERENRALSSALAEGSAPELPEGVKDIRDKILRHS